MIIYCINFYIDIDRKGIGHRTLYECLCSLFKVASFASFASLF